MTDERAKRFPLALADLVREPRKGAARPDARIKPVMRPVMKAVGAGSGSSRVAPADKIGAPVTKPAAVIHSGPKLGAAGKAKPPARASTTAAAATSKPSTVAARHLPGALRSATRHGDHLHALPKPNRQSSVQPPPAPGAARKTSAIVVQASTHALTSERVRERMVERLRTNGITDARVLAAMLAVPRHQFVDPGLAAQAYEDAALPIGHHQTISKPSVVARMIELVAAGRTLKNVLEIGTGCGYQAAVLSQVATDVYSIERIRPLSERAKLNLRPLRVPNIRLHYGDGRLGLPAVAPFDAIVIACAGLDVPQALLDQLAVGGRLVAPVGSQEAQAQILTLVERVSATQWRESRLDRVFFVPLKSGVI